MSQREASGKGRGDDASTPATPSSSSPAGEPGRSLAQVRHVTRLAYGRHLRVLLVDADDTSAAAFLAAADESVLDVTVEVADSVDDTIDRLVNGVSGRRKRLPDILVAALAITASHELLTRLRDDERLADVPVLVLASERDSKLERRSFSLGAAGHLPAPRVDYERVALVHALLDFMPTARAALAQLESRR